MLASEDGGSKRARGLELSAHLQVVPYYCNVARIPHKAAGFDSA
jgi:hypothetical protein